MDKPWYRKWFGHTQPEPQPPAPGEEIRTKANLGDPEAQFGLGLRYASGRGEEADFAQAIQWYLKAAAQHHPLAQFNLGVMYTKGQGVERDEVAAAKWFEKAALQGDPGAQFNLGVRCQRSSFKGIASNSPESKIEAFKWYQLAAAQGYKDSAAACDTLTLSMSVEEVADGARRAAKFVANHEVAL